MITETYYSVKVEKITKVSAFTDTEILLNQRCESVEIERILKAINRGLRE